MRKGHGFSWKFCGEPGGKAGHSRWQNVASVVGCVWVPRPLRPTPPPTTPERTIFCPKLSSSSSTHRSHQPAFTSFLWSSCHTGILSPSQSLKSTMPNEFSCNISVSSRLVCAQYQWNGCLLNPARHLQVLGRWETVSSFNHEEARAQRG